MRRICPAVQDTFLIPQGTVHALFNTDCVQASKFSAHNSCKQLPLRLKILLPASYQNAFGV